MLTVERLRDALHYDPDTGVFTWLIGEFGRTGRIAGHLNTFGHRQITIDGQALLAHRLAWLYVHGKWPKEFLDHVNCRPDDNRLSNLREASRTQNAQNKRLYKTNTVGLKGVHYRKRRYNAAIRVAGRSMHLGTFATAELAHAAYAEAAIRIFGEFARLA